MLDFRRLVRLKARWILAVVVLLAGISVLFYLLYPRPAENEVGVCLHLSDYDNQTMSYLTDLRVKWVRTDWMMTSDNSMRNYSQDLQDNNINLLAIIDHNTFGQQIPTLEEWERTLTEIVTSEEFRNTDAVEIWNEPNSNMLNSHVPPETYYEMLKRAYAIIKDYTAIPVIFAGASPNVIGWQTYLSTVFAYDDTQDYFDYMGIHLYDSVTTNLDNLQFVKSLTSKPVWLTETGQPSASGNYTEAGQAEYIGSVYSTFEPLVDKMFIYELRDGRWASPEKENCFGLLTLEGTEKEAYFVIWNISRNIENE